VSVLAFGQAAPDAAPRSAVAPAAAFAADNLADDAAAAGQTSTTRDEPPPAAAPAPRPGYEGDPIGDIAASAADVDPSADAYDQYRPHPVRHFRAPHRRIHHVLHRMAPAVVPVRAPAPTPQPHAAPTPILTSPHRLHLVVAPPPKLAGEAPEPAVTTPTLPDVQSQPSAVDRQAQFAALESALAADGAAAQMRLSPEIASGRSGEADITLPADAVADLQAKAEAAGLDPESGPMTLTVVLSGQGYDIDPGPRQTEQLQAGSPAAFRWRITPYAGSSGALSAELEATAPIDGKVRSLSLGTITAELPALSQAQPAEVTASAPPPAPAPQPELGQRLRTALGHLRASDLAGLRLRDLAIPGRPTLDLPVLGEVPSEDVVAGGLALLLLMFLRSLVRGAEARTQRRRRFEAFEDGYFGDGAL
jgi:hypothetical protein